MKQRILAILLLITINPAIAQKKVINSVDDIPRYTYAIDVPATEVFSNMDKFGALYQAVEKDHLRLLAEYEIRDQALQQKILNTLIQINLLRGTYGDIPARVEAVRALEGKPSPKLTKGMIEYPYLQAAKSNEVGSAPFMAEFGEHYKSYIDSLPYEVVQDALESLKGSLELLSENLYIGIIRERMEEASKKGELSSDLASNLISYKYMSSLILPMKTEMIGVLDAYLQANKVEKPDIWKDRNIDLTGRTDLSPVRIAIWDSGIDHSLFPGQMYVNDKELEDQLDNDGNGFVDDLNGIAYDLFDDKTSGNLAPIDPGVIGDITEAARLSKGLSDLQANINSAESSYVKRMMSGLKPEEVRPTIERISLYSIYAHGTHVAGIAAEGNPAVRLVVGRITFDHKMIPEIPTIELATKNARATAETIAYFKETGVRVVNMSFGGSPAGVEAALEANGVGNSAQERQAMARKIFDITKKAFYEAIKDAPEILFITSAGNSDEDSEFHEAIPSSFNLPNILTVGAVDQAGEETGFSSFGDNVDVHANGFEVESFVPGGERRKMSGTSMSSPNVANLAGQLLALSPDLTVKQTIDLIVGNCDVSEDGRIKLINPKKSMEALKL